MPGMSRSSPLDTPRSPAAGAGVGGVGADDLVLTCSFVASFSFSAHPARSPPARILTHWPACSVYIFYSALEVSAA